MIVTLIFKQILLKRKKEFDKEHGDVIDGRKRTGLTSNKIIMNVA
jgi:hypothetical protein